MDVAVSSSKKHEQQIYGGNVDDAFFKNKLRTFANLRHVIFVMHKIGKQQVDCEEGYSTPLQTASHPAGLFTILVAQD